MAERTKIEWTDHTHNHWTGCTKVSPACDHCYAESWAKRSGVVKWGPGEQRRMTTEANRRKPLKWNKEAEAAGVRKRVFCNSLADVFDAEVADAWRIDLMELIRATPSLDWLLLTKRPQVAKKWANEKPLPANVWLGTTVENQAMADLRIPILLSIKATKRFLSCEPLLGPVDLRAVRWGHANALTGLDWVIVGGESGRGARPAHPDWVLSIRDQCAGAGVPFFFKQWGEWAPVPGSPRMVRKGDCFLTPGGSGEILGADLSTMLEDVGTPMRRVGKKRAGHLLNGVEHQEFPT